MNRDNYDLDLTCYFKRDDTGAGETLQEIYDRVATALMTKYRIERKPSAIRLHDCDADIDFHIDVVPGRFVDENSDDVFLYRSGGEKGRLKTNLGVHISHVRDSGLIDPIRLLKLWASRNNVGVKTFALELLIIELLSKKREASLASQLEHIFIQFRDHSNSLNVTDPANPTGNDLSELLSASARFNLATWAQHSLNSLSASGWVAVYGETDESIRVKTIAGLARIAASTRVPVKPFSQRET